MNTVNFVTIPASIVPDQEAVVFGEQRLTYAGLNELIARLAAVFKAQGLRPRDVIAALDTNSHLYVARYYAAAKAGLTFLPLNYRAREPELEYMINTAGAKLLLVGDRYLELVTRLRPRLKSRTMLALRQRRPRMDPLAGLIGAAEPEEAEAEVDEEEISVLMYTSGTTSLPKGVMLRFRDFTAYVTANVEMADGTDRGVALVCVPFYHIAGTTAMMTNLWTGRKMVVMPQFEAAGVAQAGGTRARDARVRRPHHDEAASRRAGFSADRSLEPDQPRLRRRADADAGDSPRDRGLPAASRFRQRLRTDRDHLVADRARSRRSSAGRQRRRNRTQAEAAELDRQAAARTSRSKSATTTDKDAAPRRRSARSSSAPRAS